MPYLVLPWAAKLARDPRILDAVEDLLGPDLLIYTSTFFIKEPRSPTIAAWHQDFDLLRFGAEGGGHGLDCANRRKPGRRLHGSPVVQGRAAAAAPCRACGREQRQPGQPEDRRAVGRQRSRGDAAGGGVLFPAPRALPPPLRSQRCGSSPDRVGAEQYSRPRASGGLRQAGGDAGPGRRPLRHFERVEAPKAELDAEAVAVHDRAVGLYRQCYEEEEARHARLFA